MWFPVPVQEAALNAVAAEVSEALRSKGPHGQPTESLSTLLGLLASLTDSTSPVAQQYMAASAPCAPHSSSQGAAGSNSSHAEAAAQDSSSQPPETSAAVGEPSSCSGLKRRSEGCEERPQQRAAKAYAAGALVQAALNAMAAGVQGPQPPTFLTPTSSAAAALAVQVSKAQYSTWTLPHCCSDDSMETRKDEHAHWGLRGHITKVEFDTLH